MKPYVPLGQAAQGGGLAAPCRLLVVFALTAMVGLLLFQAGRAVHRHADDVLSHDPDEHLRRHLSNYDNVKNSLIDAPGDALHELRKKAESQFRPAEHVDALPTDLPECHPQCNKQDG